MDSDTLNLNAIPVNGCWVRPTFQPVATGNTIYTPSLDVSGAFLVGTSGTNFPDDFSCNGWSEASSSSRGLTLTGSGGFGKQNCSDARPVACCKPTPIPEPSASLSLPVGVMGLAGLAAMKRNR